MEKFPRSCSWNISAPGIKYEISILSMRRHCLFISYIDAYEVSKKKV